jgi:hypothetical protein
MSYADIKINLDKPNYVPPISSRQIGWLAFADGLPIDEVANDSAMRRGWLQAWRDCGNAQAGTEYTN